MSITLCVGDEVMYNGEKWQITEFSGFNGETLVLQNEEGTEELVSKHDVSAVHDDLFVRSLLN